MLAFLVVGVTFLGLIGALVVFAVDGQYDLLLGVIAAMTNIASGSLGYYFGVRSSQGATLKHPLRKLRKEEEDSSTAPTLYESDEV
uniref:Transmembrane protein n=1 Tax=Pithovirus LCPAC304 TaxID=2506594 RepID=A0A481Z8J9_9VIRU|nr:MAG: hypothetical protein LCPAC304_01430 [Pithovirus LCPAC304]